MKYIHRELSNLIGQFERVMGASTTSNRITHYKSEMC